MSYIDFISPIHTATPRDYLAERVLGYDKADSATVAKLFGKDYWDGERRYGYGGYNYDGRWRSVAEQMVKHYKLTSAHSVLDIGCGKGYLLYELTQVVPGIQITGLDVSQYAIENSKEEIRPYLKHGNANDLDYDEHSFDFVMSINTLHNLYNYDLMRALQEIQRVARFNKYIVVDSYRTEREKVNLLYWQLTCECFYTPEEWEWFFAESGYDGDYGYVFYE